MTRLAALLLLPSLGLVLLFGVNPGKTTLRRRLLALVICSLFFAPFIAALYYYFPDNAPDGWYLKLAWTFLFGPVLLLFFAGIGALDYFVRQLCRLVWRWWGSSREGPAS